MKIGTSDPRSKGINLSTLGPGGQWSKSLDEKIGHKNPFWRNFSRTIRRILTL